jgi:hypothetical protein
MRKVNFSIKPLKNIKLKTKNQAVNNSLIIIKAYLQIMAYQSVSPIAHLNLNQTVPLIVVSIYVKMTAADCWPLAYENSVLKQGPKHTLYRDHGHGVCGSFGYCITKIYMYKDTFIAHKIGVTERLRDSVDISGWSPGLFVLAVSAAQPRFMIDRYCRL